MKCNGMSMFPPLLLCIHCWSWVGVIKGFHQRVSLLCTRDVVKTHGTRFEIDTEGLGSNTEKSHRLSSCMAHRPIQDFLSNKSCGCDIIDPHISALITQLHFTVRHFPQDHVVYKEHLKLCNLISKLYTNCYTYYTNTRYTNEYLPMEYPKSIFEYQFWHCIVVKIQSESWPRG